MRRHRPYDKKEKGNDFSANGEGGGARPSARRPLTCLGRRVLLAPLEGVPEQQLIAPAPRAHQNHADGAGVVPHPAGGLGRGRAGAKAGTGRGWGAVGTPRWTGRGRGTERSEDWLGAGAEGSQADVFRATVTQTRLPLTRPATLARFAQQHGANAHKMLARGPKAFAQAQAAVCAGARPSLGAVLVRMRDAAPLWSGEKSQREG